MPAPPLPIECMQLILEHFDDTFALHSLLLTSKAWFPLVAERLYHDPFTRIHRCKNTPRALSLFLSRVVLCCSPCKDPVVAALRHRFMAETSASTVESRLGGKKTPSIDYLSLVKIIRFSPRVLHAIAHLMERQEPKKPVSKGRKKKRDVNIASSNLSPRTESTEHGQVAQWQIEIEGGDLFLGGMTDMKLEMAKASVSHAIVVAIAEHQFHNIQELQIPRQYLRQYYLQFSVVQALSNLECVIFDLGFGAVYQEMIQNTHDFVREYAGVHGMRRGQFDILYVGGKSVEFLQTFPIIHQTYSLLRPHYTPKYITDYNGGGELIDSLARVQCIQLTRICDQTTVRAVMARLKECRLLKELWVTIDTRGTGTNGNININNSENLSDQSHIFEWAINRTNEVFKSPFVSHTLLLPPLCRVNLSYNGLNPERLIEHLFSAFGPTLEDVNLEVKSSQRGALRSIGDTLDAWYCERLRHLKIWSNDSLVFHPSIFAQNFPSLQTLCLQDMGSCVPEICHPWINMPNLVRLDLEGLPACQFNLSSLKSMPLLRELSLKCCKWYTCHVGWPQINFDQQKPWSSRYLNVWPETVPRKELIHNLFEHEFKHPLPPPEDTVDTTTIHYHDTTNEPPADPKQPSSANAIFCLATTGLWLHPSLKHMELLGLAAHTIPLISSPYLAICFPNLESLVLDLVRNWRSLDNEIYDHKLHDDEWCSSLPDSTYTSCRYHQHHVQYHQHHRLRTLRLRGSTWLIHQQGLWHLFQAFPNLDHVYFDVSCGISPSELIEALIPTPPNTSSFDSNASTPCVFSPPKHIYYSRKISYMDAAYWKLEKIRSSHSSSSATSPYFSSSPSASAFSSAPRANPWIIDEHVPDGEIFFYFDSGVYRYRSQQKTTSISRSIIATLRS